MAVDPKRSIEQLEGVQWGAPEGATNLMLKVHALRKVPTGSLSVENLRLMIGQQQGLPHILPLALEILETDPWACGELYDGDLLMSVLSIPATYWAGESVQLERLTGVVQGLVRRQELLESTILPAWQELFAPGPSA